MPGGTTGFVTEVRRAVNGLLLRVSVVALIFFVVKVPETKGCSLEDIRHDRTGSRS
ncbi:hypothetical protein [Pseudonocardia sp.]|uniref:hypothetical protein n=1 Tax=Pseudonocardia sp. TaxID=60912 RepID=UPI0031FD94E8